MSKVFTNEGKLEESVVDLIAAEGFGFIPRSYILNEKSRKDIQGLPLEKLPDGRLDHIAIYQGDGEVYYGTVYFAVQTSEIVEIDASESGDRSDGHRNLSEVPEKILSTVKESIRQPPAYAYGEKSYQLYN